MSRTTIKDIAKKLGVSPSTISRALADHADISTEMKKKVTQVAKELHYTKNRRASSLRTKASDIIALIVPEINMFFMPELIYGVNMEAEKHGISVMVFQSDNSFEKEQKLLQYCLEMSFGGVLLCLSLETNSLQQLDEIIACEIPVVLLDKVLSSDKYSTISILDENAGHRSGEYLYKNGHRQVIGIFANSDLTMTKNRVKGFKKAFSEQDDSPASIVTLNVENILELDEHLETLLKDYPESTAIFCMSDELLVNTHHVLMKNGYKIPDDISLFAISDGFAPYFLYPNVSHLHHSGYEVGVEAIKELKRYFEEEEHEPDKITVSTKLFEMDSVKKLNT